MISGFCQRQAWTSIFLQVAADISNEIASHYRSPLLHPASRAKREGLPIPHFREEGVPRYRDTLVAGFLGGSQNAVPTLSSRHRLGGAPVSSCSPASFPRLGRGVAFGQPCFGATL